MTKLQWSIYQEQEGIIESKHNFITKVEGVNPEGTYNTNAWDTLKYK